MEMVKVEKLTRGQVSVDHQYSLFNSTVTWNNPRYHFLTKIMIKVSMFNGKRLFLLIFL